MSRSFFMVPQLLYTDPKYKKMSCESKTLYFLMLNRMRLSEKNGWIKDGKPFIYFTRDEVCENLNCGKDKATRLLAELEQKGLISRKKVYCTRPDVIFVNDISEKETPDEEAKSVLNEGDFSDPKEAENQTSKVAECRPHEDDISDTNNTYNKNTDYNNTYPTNTDTNDCDGNVSDFMIKLNENLEIDTLKSHFPFYCNAIDEIRDIAADVILGRRGVRFEGKLIPKDIARERFKKLGYENIKVTLDAIQNAEEIRRPDLFIAAMLYNSTFMAFSSDLVGIRRGQ